MAIESSTSDERMPSGVGPIRMRADDPVLHAPASTTVHVRASRGAEFDLANR